ncbi:hypothetical protein R3P38DRAFT_3173227 [Favolaschia claudopus]|uniref:RING-type domain-containing protein n=1 Tax=Favolaschia claudopus TaxID=2862362 RepID=A0AAW0DGY7_9AGAR
MTTITSTRRVSLDAPSAFSRSSPLTTVGRPYPVTMFSPSEWRSRGVYAGSQRVTQVAGTTQIAGTTYPLVNVDPPAADVPFEGSRVYRPVALQANDLWIGSVRPDPPLQVFEEYICAICLSLKSHPVSYVCGHGHCFVCIRLWLERDWRCPECRVEMDRPPFRMFVEEKSILRLCGDWDSSEVTYDFSGLSFPSRPL